MSNVSPPPCPITGAPPVRHVQRISPTLLKDLWRIIFKVDVTSDFAGVERFDLWESPTGLHYFSPPLAGDTGFYKSFYDGMRRRGHYPEHSIRGAFRVAASEIGDGERVLDVGCGYGGLRTLIPHARYLGLDPNFGGEADWACKETLEQHLETMEGQYDVACAFEVIEHVPDPALMVRNLARAVRPGGRVIVSVPHVPSALTRIPNFVLNAPPHHLTWWTDPALRAVASQAGLETEKIVAPPWCDVSSKMYWVDRFTLIKSSDVYFRHSWPIHISSMIGMALGIAADKAFGPPKNARDEGAGLQLFARKPD
ncbi:MAG: class I SAM-dependent methyltransferase [Pseudorhodoplanes sp.]|uniref:class I SAM-dependent methyltransferase n=1 Tax=Pseudorhodoplanes sp. TaxID=1934341 RepID=UPI003D10F277